MHAEEEKHDARARREEEKARKAEEKRLRDEEKRKSRDAKATAKAPVQEEVVAESVIPEPVNEAEPPVLEPIPHVEPNIAVTEPKLQPLPVEEERIEPTPTAMTEKEEGESELELEPAVTAETGLASGEILNGDAEAIARRVFNAPVQNEDTSGPGWEPPPVEVLEAAKATENVEEAPVVKAEIAPVPAVEPPTVEESMPSSAPVQTSVITEPSSTTKHDAPVAARIAPVAPVMETTVTGGTSPKAKDSKGVSSWLKTKFRRSSKATKSEPSTEASEPKEKAFVGGANFAAPGNKTSSEQGESSMREVAMAGKETAAAPATSTEAPVVSPAEEDMYDASPRATSDVQHDTPSLSISSLSSDEDTRGRSAIRRDHQQGLTQGQFIRQEAAKQNASANPTLGSENVDPVLLTRHGKTESSSAGGDQEFEEARDTFDSEKLQPPGVVGTERKSDSPARDSKFLEDL